VDISLDFDYLKHLSEGHSNNDIIKEIIQAHGKELWNYAYSIVGNAEMTDDIMQDVFIKVVNKLHTFRGASSIKTWLLSITRNTAYNSKSTWFIRKVLPFEKWSERQSYPSAESEAIEQIEMNDAWETVMKLPVKYREVLVLMVHHDMSQKEIAETIGVPEGTVKSRLHHARLKFAKQYKGGIE
jgi:RNA polymerase sigma-70 factor (ECF subfamily)